MRFLLSLGFSLIALPALAGDAAPPDADIAASIDIGRFGVMVDQMEAAQKVLVPGSGGAVASADTGPQSEYQKLVTTVLRFNVIADRLCAHVALPAEDCAGPFMPDWLATKPRDPGDPVRLRAMIDEAGSRIGTFWGDICDRAKAAGGDSHLCDIE